MLSVKQGDIKYHFFESSVWLDLRLNSGLSDRWQTLYALDQWPGPTNYIFILQSLLQFKSIIFYQGIKFLSQSENPIYWVFWVNGHSIIRGDFTHCITEVISTKFKIFNNKKIWFSSHSHWIPFYLPLLFGVQVIFQFFVVCVAYIVWQFSLFLFLFR